MISLMEEFEKGRSKEAKLAKDADILEQLLQELAKAIMSGGVKDWWWNLQNKPSIKNGKPKFYGKKIKD